MHSGYRQSSSTKPTVRFPNVFCGEDRSGVISYRAQSMKQIRVSEFKADRKIAKGYSARKEEETMWQIGGISETCI